MHATLHRDLYILFGLAFECFLLHSLQCHSNYNVVATESIAQRSMLPS